MRIISGIRRGHKLFEFEGDDVRPTTDRVKESVFNIIQTFIPDAVCLDMFAGSGALSFEAISRGAKKAVCLDKDKRSIDNINRTLALIKTSVRLILSRKMQILWIFRITVKLLIRHVLIIWRGQRKNSM